MITRFWQRTGDRVLIVGGFAAGLHAFWRDRRVWQRLGDVEVLNGIFAPTMYFLLVRQRRDDRAMAEFAKTSGEFGTFIGNRMKVSDQRNDELLDLTRSLKRLTRWLVVLTIVVGLIGAGSIGATIAVAT